ncbi:histone-fold-containing protein [Lentinus tigrinus ALCF2SS1-7]|uniref:Histone-fold-containing protein n=1 Tax=Lentinus tigrinus ALCF2SS1-6 TaxID=1328759 RepID=A0A5C2SF86_9APHY|nr:histone-fold-containing protein [Lentinus tigrinus ALCF2SS1-6]RPD77739.1 histone-fold-containing protein [Lentinus tigrinus ALCF2SS1-7]
MSRPASPNADAVLPEAMDTDERSHVQPAEESSEGPTKAKAKKPKAPETLTREAGKSLLPHARVQRILKADKDLIMVQREASFLISRATEEFIQRIAEAAQQVAERERRSTVQAKDLIASVRRADEFAFLEELLPYLEPEPSAAGRSKARTKEGNERGKLGAQNTMLDQFVKKHPNDGSLDEDGDAPQTKVITHEDGTMEVLPVEAPP